MLMSTTLFMTTKPCTLCIFLLSQPVESELAVSATPILALSSIPCATSHRTLKTLMTRRCQFDMSQILTSVPELSFVSGYCLPQSFLFTGAVIARKQIEPLFCGLGSNLESLKRRVLKTAWISKNISINEYELIRMNYNQLDLIM
jgi:hypothetical protein